MPEMLMIIVAIFLYVFLAFFFEWFERKVYAKLQGRVGPSLAGPFGVLQPLADFLKLLSKEEFRFGKKSYIVDLFAILSLSLSILPMFFIPLFGFQLLSVSYDLLFLIFLLIFSDVLIVMASLVYQSRYQRIGALRMLGLISSYEILFLSSLAPVFFFFGFNLKRLIDSSIPLIIFFPISFFLYLISLLARVERVPFDIPTAESEIAGGWVVEFSGRVLAFFKLSNSLKLLFLISLGSLIFFGIPSNFPNFAKSLILFSEMLIMTFLISLIRGAFSRYRIDMAVDHLWKYFLPLSLIQLLVAWVI